MKKQPVNKQLKLKKTTITSLTLTRGQMASVFGGYLGETPIPLPSNGIAATNNPCTGRPTHPPLAATL